MNGCVPYKRFFICGVICVLLGTLANVEGQTLRVQSPNTRVMKETKKLTGIVPEPQKVYQFSDSRSPFVISAKTILMLEEENSAPLLKQAVSLLQKDFKTLYGLDVPVVQASLGVQENVLMLGEAGSNLKALATQARAQFSTLPVKGDESYRLMVDTKLIAIDSPAPAGVFYGVQTLRQMLREDKTIPALAIADWPDQALRMAYLYPFPGMVDKMARLKINACIIESQWNASGNWWYNPTGKNREEAALFFKQCRENNIEPVPLVQGLGWAYGVVDLNPHCSEGLWVRDEKVVFAAENPVSLGNPNVIRTHAAPIVVTNTDKTKTYREEVDYKIIPGVTVRPFAETNKPWQIVRLGTGAIADGQAVRVSYNYGTKSPSQTPYCPSEPETYQIVNRVLKNVIESYKPRYIHIGHDEVIYSNRCSRCVSRNLSTAELLSEDIRHWYDTIHSFDPTIKIMIWDDLLRENHPGESLMAGLPEDMIICSWVYEADPKNEKRIQDHMTWFVEKNKNPVLGTASGYFHDNIWIWKQMAKKYAKRPNLLGFIYTHWGESYRLYSALSFSAEYMWSQDKPNKQIFDLYASADMACRELNLGLTLSLPEQTGIIVGTVNLASLSTEGGPENVRKLTAKLKAVGEKVKPHILPELAVSTVAMGTVSERPLTQMEALPEYYRMMGIYARIGKDDGQEDKKKTLEALTKISQGFARWHFPGYEKTPLWLAAYENDKKLPSFKDIFGFEIKAE
jgi:hypothetical protein